MNDVAHKQPSLIKLLITIIKSDLRLAMRSKQELFNALLFFVLVAVLFPLGVDPGPDFLKPSSGGLIWVSFMLALMIGSGNMFKTDFDDGTIELWVLSGQPLFCIVLAKVFAQWLITTLPLLLISPLLATMLYMPVELMSVMLLTLLIGTPALCMVVSIGAALITGTKGGGVLLMLIVLPLATPILIFATGVIAAFAQGLDVGGLVALLTCMLVGAVVLCPFATAAALKLSVDH